MSAMTSRPLRVASVQIECLPTRLTHQQRLWVPEEALLGPDPIGDHIDNVDVSVAHLAVAHPQFQTTRRSLEQLHTEAVRLRLLRILEFCKQLNVDVVVTPEYSIPPSLLSVLIGYSSEMIIVAGMGIVRPTDLDLPNNRLCGICKPYSNCAVVVGPNILDVVTKQYPSEGEWMEPGTGARTFEVTVRGRVVRLGVAICMDYIHLGHTFGKEGAHLDVVAVPALSRTTEVFEPDEPRDFVRVIANHAAYGGSRILLPRPSGAAFTNDKGTLPLVADAEGVVVVDFDRFVSAPRSTFATQNRVIAMAAVFASPSDLEQTVVETIQSLPLSLQSDSDLATMLDSWIERTRTGGRLNQLHGSLSAYKRLASSELLREEDHSLLTSHILVPLAKSSRMLRNEQAKLISATLRGLVSEDTPASIFEAQRAYASVLAALAPPPKDGATHETSRQPKHTYFALGLGRFDADEATATIPYQLDLLRAFSLSFNQDFTLDFRVTSVEDSSTKDMGAQFEILLGGVAPTEAVVQQTSEFARAYRAVLLSGWACYTSDSTIASTANNLYSIEPVEGDQALGPAIRSDWGAVVDVVRAQASTLSIDIMCSPLSGAFDAPSVGDSHTPAAISIRPSRQPVRQEDRAVEAFADFLTIQATDRKNDPPSLQLRIVVSSSQELSNSLLNTIGTILLGHGHFRIRPSLIRGEPLPHVSGNAAFCVRPDEALRIAHPPHGHIEGRGLGRRRDLELLAKQVPLMQTGCVVGSAVAARAYTDTRFDLAINEESRKRHVYVIGKTGVGKTNLLKNMVRQDIASGAGVVIIDPHGDLAEYALGHCGSRAEDCVYLDFADQDSLPIVNPLMLDVATEAERLLATEELVELFTRRTYHEWYGPRFEDTVRMALDTLRFRSPGAPYSLLDVPGLLRNSSTRRAVLKAIPSDSDLHDRWKVFDSMRDSDQAEMASWVLAKFAEFEQSEVLRFVLAAQHATFSLSDIVTSRKILIVRLPEAIIGARAVSFLGSFIVSRITRHIVQGHAIGAIGPAPFFMYVDEFQKFVSSGFESLIPEARKFGLGLVLAHQNTDQLRAFSRFEGARDSSVLTQILGNVGTIICFKIGSRDAELIGPELGIEAKSLLRIGRYRAVARVVADGIEMEPVTIAVYDSASEPGYPETRERVRRMLRDRGILLAIQGC